MSDKSELLASLKIEREPPSRADRSGAYRWTMAGAALIVVVAAAWLLISDRHDAVTIRLATAVPASTGLNTRASVLDASGYVVARRSATVSAKITGKVTEVMIEEGQRVKAGDIIASLEDTNENAQLALAQAQLGVARSELAQLQQSLNSVLSFSFFITKKMKTQLKAGRIRGTLPVLYVFLARAGKTIQDVELIALDEDGTVHPDADLPKSRARGVKIVFAGEGGKEQTLYYFSTDVSNGAIERSGFLKFCEGHGRGDALLKSASYLMHSGGFTTVRDFVLARSDAIVQDDSGIPLRNFEREDWEFDAFGNYLGPISIFPGRYQRDLRALFARQKTDKLDFSIGYRWRPNQSNLLLARRADHVSKTD